MAILLRGIEEADGSINAAPGLAFLPLDAFTYVTLFISGRRIKPLTGNFCVIWYKLINFELACLLRCFRAFSAEDKMRTFADTEVQARLMREMRELYEKRGKLEAGIRAVDAARTLRMEKDALHDIATYRALLSRPQPS